LQGNSPLFLSNSTNSFSGGLTLGGTGTLVVGGNGVLGSGTLTLAGGTIQAPVGGPSVSLANPVVLFGYGPGTTTLGGQAPLTFSGTTTLVGANTLAMASTSTTTFSGVIGGTGALTVTSQAGLLPGPLLLSNVNNTFTSGLTLAGARYFTGGRQR